MNRRKIDAIDRRILAELQRDSKQTNVDLAAKVGLSASPCLARVKQLERDGILKGYVGLVSPEALGLTITVFIQITLERQAEKMLGVFETRIRTFPEVMECYLMSGDSDYLVRVVVADVEALQNFIVRDLTTIPGVANIRSSFALKQVTYKTALPLSP
ncbi:MAG: Lrp/AsnC family transcriptional regulator [Paracoccaceae bacterium]